MSPRTLPTFLTAIALAFAGLGLAGSAAVAEPNGNEPISTTLYHPDQDHLWNRVHSALLIRVGPNGRAYGEDRLEPLLWPDSTHLLEGAPADRAVAVLEEFVREDGEGLIDDSLKRAFLQRDLWLIFNWLAQQGISEEDRARQRLASLLAQVIGRLALSSDEIAKLPDNYSAAVDSKRFADRFDPDQPKRSYLPPGLFKPAGPWVCIGRTQGPTAPRHIRENGTNGFANSVFLIFLKFPAGRQATLDFMQRLAEFDEPLYIPNTDEKTSGRFLSLPNPDLPHWPRGTEVALVRRALLIDSNGQIVASSLTESVQLRVMRTGTPAMTAETLHELRSIRGPAREKQAFAEFQLRRRALFAGKAGGLRDVSEERDFKTGFGTHHWDEFEVERSPEDIASFPEGVGAFRKPRTTCISCHLYPGIYSFNSFHSGFPSNVGSVRSEVSQAFKEGLDIREVVQSHSLAPMPVEKVGRAAVKWKKQEPAWGVLEKLLRD